MTRRNSCRSMIDVVNMPSDLGLYVLGPQVKRGPGLSTYHLLSWIRMPDSCGVANHVMRVCWECLPQDLVHKISPHLWLGTLSAEAAAWGSKVTVALKPDGRHQR